jgi:PAS domain S-box-containing protein
MSDADKDEADTQLDGSEEAALRHSEEQYRALAELSDHMVWTLDPNGQITYLSQKWFDFTGIPLDELQRSGWLDALHPDDREPISAAFRAYLASSTPYTMELRLRDRLGAYRWQITRALPVLDPDGAVVRWHGVTFDIDERKRAEEALARSEQRFRRVVESRPVGVLFADTAGRITDANQTLLDMLGYSREQLIGMPWATLTPPAYAERDAEATRELLATGSVQPYEKAYLRADGTPLPVLVAATMLRTDASFEAVGFVVNDAERRRLFEAEREARLRLEATAALLGQALEAAQMLAWDAIEGKLTLSSNASAILGSEVALAAAPSEAAVNIHPDDAAAKRAQFEHALATGSDYHAVYRFWNADRSEWLWLEDHGRVRYENGRPLGISGVTQDITARKRAELEREELLAREQELRAQAEEASRLKDEFLATVSHELRTPLTAFLGYTQLLQLRKRDEAYVARTVEKMARSAQAQAQLIEDLLDISRIVSGKLRLDPAPVQLTSVIAAALDLIKLAAEAKQLDVQVRLDPAADSVVGDASRLQQVVWNLLANAVKFTPVRGQIELLLERDNAVALLTVRDTGCGIRPEFLPFVFERFRQADGTTNRAFGGLGLGLAIVRHLVELHGGSVEAHSAGEGQGATFHVRLPLATATPSPTAPLHVFDADHGCPPELAGLRLLIVDDQPAILELLHELLAVCGAEVRTSTNARAALAELQSWRPDLLLSDIAMPGEDGYWLIEQVRALGSAEGGDTPAIALTAYVRMEDRLRVLRAGYNHYVPKPIDAVELRAVVVRVAHTGA